MLLPLLVLLLLLLLLVLLMLLVLLQLLSLLRKVGLLLQQRPHQRLPQQQRHGLAGSTPNTKSGEEK